MVGRTKCRDVPDCRKTRSHPGYNRIHCVYEVWLADDAQEIWLGFLCNNLCPSAQSQAGGENVLAYRCVSRPFHLGAAVGCRIRVLMHLRVWQQVTLWKTVDGVYTADPRMCKAAFPVPFLSYDEAIELAYFGGQVGCVAAECMVIVQRFLLRLLIVCRRLSN
jgi:hypothetical protein